MPDGGEPCLIAATHDGWVHGLPLPLEGREPLWSFPAGETVTASPRTVRLEIAGHAEDLVLVASYSGWIYLLQPPSGDGESLEVVWSFRARASIGSTPLLFRRDGKVWVAFTDFEGWVYGVPLGPPLSDAAG